MSWAAEELKTASLGDKRLSSAFNQNCGRLKRHADSQRDPGGKR
jgi:hypothetical protein